MPTRTDRPPAPLQLLGAVTLALVLVTSGVVVAGWAGRLGGPAAQPGRPDDASGGRQMVSGGEHDAAVFEVGDGWVLRPRGTSLFYTDAEGRISAGLDGAAVFRDGVCAAGEGASNRAFAGFGRPSRLPARRTSRVLAQQWRDALAHDARTGTTHEAGALRTREVGLDDGSTAVRTDVGLVIVEPSACEAARVRASVVSLDTGRWTTSVVLVRDLGVPDALDGAAAERLLASLRPTGR
jgi:hypothetical protein